MPPGQKDAKMNINQWFRFVSWRLCGNPISVAGGSGLSRVEVKILQPIINWLNFTNS
jgi:hypothetical protein